MASYEELRKQRERKQVPEGSAPYVTPQINPVNTGAGSTYERLKLQREVRQNPSYVDMARQYGEYVSSAGDRFAKMQEEANKQYNLVNDAYKRDRIAKVNPEITKITGSPRLTAGGAISVNNAADILAKQREAERLEREKAAKDRRNMYAADLKALDTNSEAYKKGLAEIEKREKFYQVKKDNPNSGLIINKLISPNMYEQQNKNGTEFLTDQERALYAYYLGMGEKDKAAQYLEDIQLNARRRGEILKATEQDARNNPGLNSFASAIYNTAKPIEGVYDLVNRLTGEKLPEANSFMISGDIANRQRDTVREKINNPVGGFLYDTGMSAVDSLMAALLPGGLGSLALGASAMRDAMTDAADKGATTEQIVMQGLAQGIAEALFEKISIGELKRFKEVPINGKKDILFNFLKSTFTNASEEGLTELSNVITDYLIMGKNGDNPDAKSIYEAVQNSLGRIGLAALGGGLMGGPFSLAGSVNSYVDSSLRGRNVTSEDLKAAMQYGREYDNADINRMAAAIDAKQATGSKVTNFEKGNLMKNVDYAKAQEQNKVLNMLRELQQKAAEEKKTSTADKVNTEENKTATEGTGERTEAFDKETKSFYGKNGQTVLEENWARNESKLSRRAYENAIYDSYMQGINHRAFEATERSSVLSEAERKLAYNAGVQDRWDSVNKGVFAPSDKPGIVDSDAAREVYVADKNGFNYADTVAKILGAQVEFNYDAKGNGYFDGNKVVINPNSSISFKAVVNHEFTHMLERYSGKAYDAYRNYVMDTLYKGDKAAVDAEVNRIIDLYARNNVKLDYDGAVREMVADAAENFLNSEESINEFVKALSPDDRSVVQKIVDFIKEAVEKLKAAIKDAPAETQTGKMLRKDLEQMQQAEKLWIKAAASIQKNETAKSQGKAASISEKTSAENVLAEIPVKKSFSITDPVEQTKDLIAIHNLKIDEMLKTLELGGFPMPSIAITKADMGHTNYGPISVVFRKETIDPQFFKSNKVYSGDAYTPEFPQIGYKIDSNKLAKVRAKINELTGQYKDLFGYNALDPDNAEQRASSEKGDIAKAYESRMPIKYAYTQAKGKTFDAPYMTSQVAYQFDNDEIDLISNMFTAKEAEDIQQNWFEEYQKMQEDGRLTQIIDALNEKKRKAYPDWDEKKFNIRKRKTLSEENFYNLFNGIVKYNKEGVKEVIDKNAFESMVSDYVEENRSDYEKWVKNLFEGVVEKSGIRNDKDEFLPSGNRRSFEQLHDEYNLQNLVKAMKADQETGKGFGGNYSFFGSVNREYESIDDIKSDKDRLWLMAEEEYEQKRQEITDELKGIAINIGGNGAYFETMSDIAEAVAKNKTSTGVKNFLAKRYKNIQDRDVVKIMSLATKTAEMPTGYFEAKPRRAVGLDEIAKVVLPDVQSEINEKLIAGLEENNIPYETYKAGDNEARKAAVNNTPDIQFSITEDSEGRQLSQEQQEYFKDSKIRDAEGRLRVVYHGTNNADFNVFDLKYIGAASGDSGYFGKGFYFAYYKGEAAYYGSKRIIDAYVNITNPFDFEKKLDSYNGLKARYGDAPDAVRMMNFAYEFPKLAENMTVSVGKPDSDEIEQIKIKDFADAFKEVIDNKKFSYEETERDYVANTLVTADPKQITEKINGKEVTYTEYGFEQEFSGDVSEKDRLDIAYEYLRQVVYSNVYMDNFTNQILEYNDEFTEELKARGYDGTMQSEDGDEVVAFYPEQIKRTDNTNPTSNPDIRYSITEDSEGNELSEGQQEYFKDSKVRDDQGRLMKMYHGTPNGTFTVFKGGSYFTNMAWYAERYQSQGASSLSYKKTADNPKTYEAYLNITKPFDTRDPKVRKIWDDQYYQKWDTGDLADSGLPDWTAAEGLLDFIEENELDYDGLIIDEGGIPGDNGEVISRGFAWVPVNGREQVKSVDNLNPTDDPDIRYSITDLTPEEIDKKLEENRKLKSKNMHLEKLYENAKKQVRLTKEFKASDAAVNKIAKETLKEFNSTFPVADFANTLHEVYEYIYNNERKGKEVNLEEVSAALTGVMEKVLEQSVYMDETDQAVRDALKGKTLIVTEDLKRNITDWNDFRREASMFKIRNGETSNIDSVYDELHDQFPWLFDTEQNVTLEDMLYDLVDTYEAAGPKSAQYGDMKEIAAQTAINLIDRYSEDIMEKPTFADKKREQLKRLKAEHKKELFEARADLADTFAKVLSHRELDLSKYEDKMLYKRVNQEQRMRKEYIDNITKSVQRLREKLFANNEKKHIPAQYVNNIAMLLKAIDLNTNIPGTQVAEQLAKYKDMYKKVLESNQGEDHMLALDDDLPAYVEEIISMLEDKPIRNLGSEVLQKISIVLHVVEGTVKNANNAFLEDQKAKLTQKGSEVLRELDSKPGKSTFVFAQKGPLKELGDLLRVYNVTPAMFYDRLSGPLQESFKTIRNAEGKYAENVQKGTEYALEMMRKYNFNDWYSKRELNDSVKTFNIGGKSLTLDRGQIMSLYVTWQREAGKYHITHGGINSDTQERVGKLKVRDTSEAIAISEADYKMITDTLTQEQKDFADAMRDYLAKECSKQGNEVTLALWQIKKYGEDKYFPIPTTGEFNYKTAGTVGDTRIKHSSFTHTLVQKASNPITLYDFMTIWSSHVEGMARYNAYTLPLEGMTRLWNYKEKLGGSAETAGGGQRRMSVRSELKRVYGAAYNTYIDHFLNDVNGSRPDERGNEFGSKLMSLMKKGAVMGNARVVIQQPSAIVRAFAYIDPKYFTNKQKGDYDELAKWNSAAKMKRMGFFDTGMGGSIVDELKKGETRNAKEAIKDFITNERGTRDDVLSKGAEMADELTWAAIWRACKAETAATTDLEQDSEAFMKHASARFTEIVDYTQVYDSVFEKSDIMRSSGTFAKMVTAFMSEPTKTYSMLWRAATKCIDAGDDKELKKAASKYVKKALIAILGSWIVNDALTSIIDVSRKGTDNNKVDKEHEELNFIENKRARVYIKTWLDSFLSEPENLVPYLKDIMSIFNGYEVKRTDMQLFQNLFWSAGKIWKKRKELSSVTVDETIGLAGTISAFFGIPVSNVYRDLKSAYGTAEKMVKDLTGITEKEESFEGRLDKYYEDNDLVALQEGKNKSVQEYNDLLYESVENGKLEDLIAYGLANGRTEDQIFNAINSKFEKQYETDIAIAAAAYKSGEIDAYNEVVDKLTRLGYSQSKTVEKAITKKVKQLNKEEAPKEEAPGPDAKTVLDNYYSDTPAKGSKVAASEKYKDIVSAYSENNRSLYAEAVKKAKASGLNTSTVKAQLTTARRKSLADNADFNKLIREAMNGDMNFINTYKKLIKEYPYSLASIEERKDDLAAVALKSELFDSFKAAVAAGDKEGMKKYGLYLRKLTGKELSALRKLASEE